MNLQIYNTTQPCQMYQQASRSHTHYFWIANFSSAKNINKSLCGAAGEEVAAAGKGPQPQTLVFFGPPPGVETFLCFPKRGRRLNRAGFISWPLFKWFSQANILDEAWKRAFVNIFERALWEGSFKMWGRPSSSIRAPFQFSKQTGSVKVPRKKGLSFPWSAPLIST